MRYRAAFPATAQHASTVRVRRPVARPPTCEIRQLGPASCPTHRTVRAFVALQLTCPRASRARPRRHGRRNQALFPTRRLTLMFLSFASRHALQPRSNPRNVVQFDDSTTTGTHKRLFINYIRYTCTNRAQKPFSGTVPARTWTHSTRRCWNTPILHLRKGPALAPASTQEHEGS